MVEVTRRRLGPAGELLVHVLLVGPPEMQLEVVRRTRTRCARARGSSPAAHPLGQLQGAEQ
jgi:hypothetical protein